MARARTVSAAGGVNVAGLEGALRALARVDRAVGREAKGLIREHTKPIAMAARARDSGSPSEPSRSTWVSWSVTNKGAAIKLRASKEPRALATEFGAHTAEVGFDRNRTTLQSKLRRRTFRPHKPASPFVLEGSGGYKIQPTIRAMAPKALEELADDLLKWIGVQLDREGVPRG